MHSQTILKVTLSIVGTWGFRSESYANSACSYRESLLSHVCQCGYTDESKALFQAESHILWPKLMTWSFIQMSHGTTFCCALRTLLIQRLLAPNYCFPWMNLMLFPCIINITDKIINISDKKQHHYLCHLVPLVYGEKKLMEHYFP